MVSDETQAVIRKSKEIFEQQLRCKLEKSAQGKFVAIEPESGDHFVADTFDEAVRLARAKHPTKLSHTIRVGHDAAFHLGVKVLLDIPVAVDEGASRQQLRVWIDTAFNGGLVIPFSQIEALGLI